MHHKLLASQEQTKLDSVDLLRGLFLSHGLGISARTARQWVLSSVDLVCQILRRDEYRYFKCSRREERQDTAQLSD